MKRVAYYYITKDGAPCRVAPNLHHNWVLVPASVAVDPTETGLQWRLPKLVMVGGKVSRVQGYRTCEALIARSVKFRNDHQVPSLLDGYSEFQQATTRGTFHIQAVYIRQPKSKAS